MISQSPDANRAAGMRRRGCLKIESELSQFVMAGLVPAIHVLL